MHAEYIVGELEQERVEVLSINSQTAKHCQTTW
jgi:hypothetical protein